MYTFNYSSNKAFSGKTVNASHDSSTESRPSHTETPRNLTNYLNLLESVDRIASADTKARLLIGLWRGSGLSWESFQDLFVMAIASQEVAA